MIVFSGGALIALSLAFFLGLDQLLSGIVGTGLMIAGGIVGAIIVPQIFNALVVGTSAFIPARATRCPHLSRRSVRRPPDDRGDSAKKRAPATASGLFVRLERR